MSQIAKLQISNTSYGEDVIIQAVVENEDQLHFGNKWFQDHFRKVFYDDHIEVVILKLLYPDNPETVKCSHCGLTVLKSESFKSNLYDSPFDDEPNDMIFCSDLCQEAMEGHLYSKDFSYTYCESCDRTICEQNPKNGWHSQFRTLDEESICNQCFEEHTFENGIDIEEFESEHIQGLFFIDSELKKHGFSLVGYGFINTLISSAESATRYCDKALELIAAGHKVINNYDRLAIGGGEGYVTMWYK